MSSTRLSPALPDHRLKAAFLLHTPGEPGGVGYECLVRLAQSGSAGCRLALADPKLLRSTAADLGLRLDLQTRPATARATPDGTLYLQPLPFKAPVTAGETCAEHAPQQLQALRWANDFLAEQRGALITGPVQKSTLATIEPSFRGHTEYLATLSNTPRVVMMLACPSLRVALLTTHLPLRAVPDAIQADDLLSCLRIIDHDLRINFGLRRPRIGVCGLNPHAGEQGLLGHEEQEHIQPALQTAQREGLAVSGPWPADTIFTPPRLAQFDVVLAMYHDQGLATLKYAGFGEAVNITLGLPYIRTSVDHGTGLDIAGRGIARTDSLRAAEAMAWEMLTAEAVDERTA